MSIVDFDSRVNGYAHLTLLAITEVSRHMPNLHRIAASDFPGINFNDLCYAVNFTTRPPTLSLKEVEAIKMEAEQKGQVIDDTLARMGSYDHSRVALLRIETTTDLYTACAQPVHRLVGLNKSGSTDAQIASILETGKASGGKGRAPCVIESTNQSLIEAEYDIIDEIVRRVDEKIGTETLLCNDAYVVVVREQVELLLDQLGSNATHTIFV